MPALDRIQRSAMQIAAATLNLVCTGEPNRLARLSRSTMVKHLSIFQKGLIVVALSLAFQLIFFGLLIKLRQTSAENEELVAQSLRVTARAENIFRVMVEAQSGMRAFLITADPSFMRPQQYASEILSEETAILRKLIRDPWQQESAGRIADKSSALLTYLAGYRDKAGPDRPLLVETVAGDRDLMADLRQEISAFIARQEHLESEREAALKKSETQADWTIAATAVLSVLLAVATLLLFSRGVAARLAVLTETAKRLSDERELPAPIGGHDEIAQVDRAFHDAAQILRIRGAALAASNRELQNFASVASHDLQEPLRKIEAFGERLATKSAAKLDQQGHEYLMRILDSAARMRKLINDLLAFSRVTTSAGEFMRVDLAEVAREVVSDLEARLDETQGKVELGKLPIIEADPTQMRQLLQNLIANGLKFHKSGEPAVVRVTAERLDGNNARPNNAEAADGFEISVQDNGIGFEEIYLDRIFEVFQRLHGRDEYEGTGIGLAICRKIVERHGGSLTARSTPGQGSTFLITLPLTQRKGLA